MGSGASGPCGSRAEPSPCLPNPAAPMTTQLPRDELLDENNRLRGPWRRMLGTLLGLGTAALRDRRAELDRMFAEEGAAALQASPGAATWRCDPIPFLFSESEFAALTTSLVQRATLLERVLADIYGEQTLLQQGLLPPALVYGSQSYLAPLRAGPPMRHLHLYAADLARAPDGSWCVLADRTAQPAGLGYVIENRRMMARTLPELFKSMEVSPIRPFFDVWQDSLLRLAPDDAPNPGLALLTPGHGDPRWFEHVVLARELGCALVEDGDLTVRSGALFLKTLRGLQQVHVLLRRQEGCSVDPIELNGSNFAGIPGLLSVLRDGAAHMLNGAGAAWAEAPGLAAFLPHIAEHLLGEPLTLAGTPTLYLGDEASRQIYEADPKSWRLRNATDPDADPKTLGPNPWEFAAAAPPVPAYAPCAGEGDTLDPRSVVIRLYLVWNGTTWRALQGGLARVLDTEVTRQGAEPGAILAGRLPRQALSKDVWVLQEEGCDIVGPEHHPVGPLPILRTVGDLPSRVADNFFWLGRYLERLENTARLSRFVLGRLARGAMLPHDVQDVAIITACLADAGIIDEEQAGASTGALAELVHRALSRDTGVAARLSGRVQDLTATLRDRLSAEMHGSITQSLRRLKGFRLALRTGRQPPAIGLMHDFTGQILEFCAIVAGYAAENMVRGGGRLFLDLGRRVERAQAVANQLAHTLDVPPERIEAGLALALELCDSALTYRARYLTALQAAPVLDLVAADEGNPRSLRYQLAKACEVLTILPLDEDETHEQLATPIEAAIADVKAMVAEVAASPDQARAASELAPRLRAIAGRMGTVSDALTRRYFTLLPATRTEGWTDATPEEIPETTP